MYVHDTHYHFFTCAHNKLSLNILNCPGVEDDAQVESRSWHAINKFLSNNFLGWEFTLVME